MTDMTDETKGDGMTLEQVRDGLRRMKTYPDSMFSKWADAIDARLAAQSAMRVDEAMELRAENELYVEAFGLLIEQLQNCNASLQLPVPDSTHVKAMRVLLPRFIETAQAAIGSEE